MGVAGHSKGKRVGTRPPRARSGGRARHLLARAALAAYAVGVAVAVVAWGYLVWSAIDFGGTARAGDGRAWWFLGLAALGAVACLFAGLMLLARLLHTRRLLARSRAQEPVVVMAQRPVGGKRAAR